MVKIISFINMKGGVGKTTLSVNVAYASSYFHRKKVLLVDVDPQFNSTQYLVKTDDYFRHINDPSKNTVYNLFLKQPFTMPSSVHTSERIVKPKPTLQNCTINITKKSGKLDLIPSALELMTLNYSPRGTENKLSHYLSQWKNAYDIIIIDCPPTISLFTISAYIASDAYVVPIKPDHMSSIGLPLLNRMMSDFEEDYGKHIDELGIIFNLVNPTFTLERSVMKEIRKSDKYVFKSFLKRSTYIARAVMENQPLFLYPLTRKTHGKAIKKITDEFIDVSGV